MSTRETLTHADGAPTEPSGERILRVTADVEHLQALLADRLTTDPFAPVRECVSNALDATRDTPSPRLRVWCDGDCLIVEDNGAGMTEKELSRGFTCIGSRRPTPADRIGIFGIGLVSTFQSARRLIAETRSREEPHGWRLIWERGAEMASLAPLPRREAGTMVRLTLGDGATPPDERALHRYLEGVFALCGRDIFIGRRQRRLESLLGRVPALWADPSPRLVPDEYLARLAEHFAVRRLDAAFTCAGDGIRLILAVVADEHGTPVPHPVSLFCRGVQVERGAADFLPPVFSALVGLVESERFRPHLARATVLRDEGFAAVQEAAEAHAVTFLRLVTRTRPEVLGRVLRGGDAGQPGSGRAAAAILPLLRDHHRLAAGGAPETVRRLGAVLEQRLVSRGIDSVQLSRQPEDPYPSMLAMSHGGAGALVLNVSHRLAQALAANQEWLDDAALDRVADGLYQIAVLRSAHEARRRAVGRELLGGLVEDLGALIGATDEEAPPPHPPGVRRRATCLAALPDGGEFEPIWDALRAVLGSPPYHWYVARAGRANGETRSPGSLRRHVRNSRRCVADVSGLDPHVLIAVGMMMEREPRALLILHDEQTVVPRALSGVAQLPYPARLRQQPDALERWLAQKIRHFAGFSSMQGAA